MLAFEIECWIKTCYNKISLEMLVMKRMGGTTLKKNHLLKRIGCVALSQIMALSLALSPLPEGFLAISAKAADADVTYNVDLSLGANVIPMALGEDQTFLNTYIRTNSSTNMNLNSQFKLSSWKNIDKDVSMKSGNSLTRSKLMHQKNEGWNATYKWTVSEEEKNLLLNSNYRLIYEGNLISDYHYNVFQNAYNHWDVGVARLKSNWGTIWEKKAGEKEDGKAQSVSATSDRVPVHDGYLEFVATHSGCTCGSSGVSGSIFYMVDTSQPKIENTYIAKNADGSGALSSGAGFRANETGYVVLDFTEDIRFADNQKEELILKLDAYFKEDNTSLPKGLLDAKLISLKGDKMIFKFTVPATVNNENINAYITGISSEQEFVNGSFNLKLYKGDGSAFSAGGLKTSTRITDIAGNPINWLGSAKDTGKIYLDNVAPVMTNISMSGSMINRNSYVNKNDWPTDLDRSAVFAGVGDWISFRISFSEGVTNYTWENVKAVLNIKDANNDPIKLSLSSHWGSEMNFEKLTVTADMLPKNGYGERIKVVGFEGLHSLTDSLGNDMVADLDTISMVADEQIYLDVNRPIIATKEEELPTVEGSDSVIYNPYADTEGEYFTFPLVIKEDISKTGDTGDTSQVQGRKASFSLTAAGEPKNFGWYVDTNQTINKEATWNMATMASTVEAASKCEYSPVDGATHYVHIKLDKNTDYSYATSVSQLNGIYFEGSIHVNVEDYAGNKASASYNLRHQVDVENPIGSIGEQAVLSVDYSDLSGTLTTAIHVEDHYGIKKIQYYWKHTVDGNTITTTPVIIEGLTESRVKEHDAQLLYNFTFDGESNAGRKGSAQLVIEFEDYQGHHNEAESSVFEYDFTMSVPNYKVSTGTQNKPLLAPEVVISEPISTADDGSMGNTGDSTKTIMLFAAGSSENGTIYYGFDPKYFANSDYSDVELFADVINKYLHYGNQEASGSWLKLEGNVDIENEAGTFVSDGESLLNDDTNQIAEYIINHYGELELIFVTSSGFESSSGNGKGYDFEGVTSTVETATVYLANNAQHKVELLSVKDASGADAKEALNYQPGMVPAQNIDNVEISISLANVTGGTDIPGYGLNTIDFSKSKIELYYYDDDTEYGSSIYEWPLQKADFQSVVIPEGVAAKTGWYGIQVTVCNLNGDSTTTKMEQYYFMDAGTVDMKIDSYYKTYIHKEPFLDDYFTTTVPARNLTNLQESEEFSVALDTNPGEGWSVNTALCFSREMRSASEVEKYGIQELVKVRVYNKADAAYESNAIWTSAEEWSYVPVEVESGESITAESYGSADAMQLPFVEGTNVICYEIVNTNGVVYTHEIVVNAYTRMGEWDLQIENTEVSENTGGLMEVKVSPVVSADIDFTEENLEDGTVRFNYVRAGHGQDDAMSYTFRNDVDYLFWMMDQNGNLSSKRCTVEDVDGESPYVVGFDSSTTYDDKPSFHFVVYANDHDGWISADDVYLTFDADYSGLLMGMSPEERANNTEQITMKLPVNRKKDAEGNYLPWESFDTEHYGIYRTQILEERPHDEDGTGGHISIEIWGTWKYDPDEVKMSEIDALPENRTLTFSVRDANGNEAAGSRAYYYVNHRYHFSTAALDEQGTLDPYATPPLDEKGNLGIYSSMPFNRIYSYGAEMQQEVEWVWNSSTEYFTTVPMIQADGHYIITVEDLFGETYDLPLDVYAFGDLGIDVVFSETDYTNQDVVVNAQATLEGDWITSITAVTDSGETITGTIDENNARYAAITMPENGVVTITTALPKTRNVSIANIDKAVEPVTVAYVDSMAVELSGEEVLMDEEVTAVVQCEEPLRAMEGSLTYTFPRGSKKGDTYTFTYTDIAGNTGSITAVLPCDISEEVQEEGYTDTTAPDFVINTYGMRDEKYTFMAQIFNPYDTVDEMTGTADVSGAVEVSGTLASYIAQKYKLMLTVEDESATKILVRENGAVAPVSYEAETTGSTVDNVEVSGTVITITENTAFDLYIIDENNNVSAVTGILVNSIDNEVTKVCVEYTVTQNDDGVQVVDASFVPMTDATAEGPVPVYSTEVIYALDPTMPWRMEEVVVNMDEYGNENTETVQRYYHIFEDNGDFTFRYKDQYGNRGEAMAQVRGLSTAAAVVERLVWYGTTPKEGTAPENGTTSEEGVAPANSMTVNKDVTAKLEMSKTISKVELFVPDMNKEANKNLAQGRLSQEEFDALELEAPVSMPKADFTEKNVFITYTENMDTLLVVRITASENGRKCYYVLPEVTCIDKNSPVVTLVSAELSEDKRSKTFTFTTDEGVVLQEKFGDYYETNNQNKNENQLNYKKEHQWTTAGNENAELTFVDQAGNVTIYQADTSDVDVTYLTAEYSTTSAGTDATTDPLDDLKLKGGASIYVRTNKAAKAELFTVSGDAERNDTTSSVELTADTWTSFTMPAEAGLHMLKLTDVNTGEVQYQTVGIQPKDNVAPVIRLESSTIILEESASVTEMMDAVKSGVSITDNEDGTITEYEVTGYPEAVQVGLYPLKYTAQDQAGNRISIERTLYIMAEGTPLVTVNGEAAQPYGTTIIRGKDVSLAIDGLEADVSLLTIKLKSGIKTVGQMKYGTTTITDMDFRIDDEGFYTIYIRTQDRVEFVTYIYVEE